MQTAQASILSRVYGTASRFTPSEPRGTCRRLLDYWRARAGDRDLPSRADIDPLHIPTLLSQLTLYDVIRAPGGLRFRYRLVGTAIVASEGADPTGRYANDRLHDAIRDEVLGFYREATETRRWLCHQAEYLDDTDRPRHYQRIILPLAPAGAPVNMLLLGARAWQPQDD